MRLNDSIPALVLARVPLFATLPGSELKRSGKGMTLSADPGVGEVFAPCSQWLESLTRVTSLEANTK
jgi:hypothetical protein